MGFLNKVKEKASEGLEKGQELAKTQQLKSDLKKLEGQLDEAYAAYGRDAFAAAEAGSLSAEALATQAESIRTAQQTIDAKKAEIDAVAAAGASG